MHRLPGFVAALVVAAAASSASAAENTSECRAQGFFDQREVVECLLKICTNAEAARDPRMLACTRVVDHVRANNWEYAIAYAERSLMRRERGEFDLALADYSQALTFALAELDPAEATAKQAVHALQRLQLAIRSDLAAGTIASEVFIEKAAKQPYAIRSVLYADRGFASLATGEIASAIEDYHDARFFVAPPASQRLGDRAATSDPALREAARRAAQELRDAIEKHPKGANVDLDDPLSIDERASRHMCLLCR